MDEVTGWQERPGADPCEASCHGCFACAWVWLRRPSPRRCGETMTDGTPGSADTPADAAASAPATGEAAKAEPVAEPAPAAEPPAGSGSSDEAQTSLAAPPPAPRGLSYAVDIVFCVDV